MKQVSTLGRLGSVLLRYRGRTAGSAISGILRAGLFALLIAGTLAAPLAAQTGAVGSAPRRQATLAFLDVANLSANPRYDYLEGLIRGVLLFDLSSRSDLALTDRASLDSVLREQELQLSALRTDTGRAAEFGRLLGADWLLRAEYVHLGSEVLVTAHLLDVTSARTISFMERGSSENTIHALSEQIIARLTGAEVSIRSPEHERSILSLQDEKPGSIALFCPLIDAELFLDGEFVGYTTGDGRIPFEMKDLRPGTHHLRIKLYGFGVVKEPEISFHDWEEDVVVSAGKRSTVRAQAWHFNDTLYRLSNLARDRIKTEEGSVDASFTDRNGKRIPITLSWKAPKQEGFQGFEAVLTYDGRERRWDLGAAAGETKEIDEPVGLVEVQLSNRNGSLEYRVWRKDIEQGMWNK